jgi:hypothetical protein
MNVNNLNNENYITYYAPLKRNNATIKKRRSNNNYNVLAKEEDRFLRKDDLLNIINKSIIYSNKIIRSIGYNIKYGFSRENVPVKDIIYTKLIPIGITEEVEHPITKIKYSIYGYPRRFGGDTVFGCRGKRTIKGTKNILHNNINQCISLNDLNRIGLKAEYNSELNKYYILVMLDNDRPISIINLEPTFLNSLSKKEEEIVKKISSQVILSIMYKENTLYLVSDFENMIYMGTNTSPLSIPKKEHIPKLTMNELVKVKEIPSWRKTTGGSRKKAIRSRK